MFRVRWACFGAVILGAQALVIAQSASAAAAVGATSCVASWNRQPVSAPGSEDNVLLSITGASATSLYATGRTTSNTADGYAGRVVRNSGSGWTDVTLPDLGPGIVQLTSSIAPAANTAWVGGSAIDGNSVDGVLLHVLGSAASTVALPAPPTGFSEFDSDSGLSLASAGGSDLWVGADYFPDNGSAGMVSRVYHRTGAAGWTTTVVPSGFLTSIAAISPSVAYVGGAGLFRVSGGSVSPVSVPGNPSTVNHVVARNANDVWLLGASVGAQFIDHFDGTSWTSVALPEPGITGPLDTIAIAPNGILWAIGQTTGSSTPEAYESTLARYDPVSKTWAATHATAGTAAGNTADGAAIGLLALGNGNVYMAGFAAGQVSPVIANLCQLPATLSGGASKVTAQTLADGVLVTAPQGTSGPATVTDTTGLITTGPLAPGQGAALPATAAATYHLRSRSTGRTATFAVPPISYTFQRKATVLIASRPAPAGYVYKLQIQTPGSSVWKSTPLSASGGGMAKYLYSVNYPAGNYHLRAQVARLATATTPAVSTGWSPAVTAVVPK